MTKIFYIEDKNGKYVSADGTKRWTRLTGKELYDFLQTERGKKTYFYIDTDDNGIVIGFEIRNKKLAEEFMRSKNHHNYLVQVQKEVGYTLVSFDCFETENGTSMGDEVISNEDESIENVAIHHEELDVLRKALSSLTEDEYALIHALYLKRNPMTEREYSKVSGIPQRTINDRKNKIFRKIKKFF